MPQRGACDLRDLGRRGWLRFGVVGSNGLWGPTWKLWSQDAEKGVGFKIGSRCLQGYLSFIRRSDEWTARFLPDDPNTSASSRADALDVKVFPECPSLAVARPLLSIRTGPDALVQRPPAGRFRYIAGIPLHLGSGNEILVVALSSERSGGWTSGWAPFGYVLLAGLTLSHRTRVAVLYRAIPTRKQTDVAKNLDHEQLPLWPSERSGGSGLLIDSGRRKDYPANSD